MSEGFQSILADGNVLTANDVMATASIVGNELWTVDSIRVSPAADFAYATYWCTVDADRPVSNASVAVSADNNDNNNNASVDANTSPAAAEGGVAHCTAVLQRSNTAFQWMILHAQRSAARSFATAPPPYYA